MEELNGPYALRQKKQYRNWTPEAKFELVTKVIAGKSYRSVAFDAGIFPGTLYQWVRKYKIYGYNGLINKQKRRK